MSKIDVCRDLETPPEKERATAVGNMHRNFGKVVFEICEQTDREADKQFMWHDASRSQWQEYALEIGEILHIFPSGIESMGGDPKSVTRVRGQVYT